MPSFFNFKFVCPHLKILNVLIYQYGPIDNSWYMIRFCYQYGWLLCGELYSRKQYNE